jgi:hypothetical protein
MAQLKKYFITVLKVKSKGAEANLLLDTHPIGYDGNINTQISKERRSNGRLGCANH